MKRISYLLFVGFLGTSLIVQASNNDPKPVVSNYTEVLSEVEYPTICREQGTEGTVLVQISVDSEGLIRGHKFLKSPCKELKDAVKEVIPKLKFEPATVNGQAISSKIIIPIEFRLTY